jgi:hypothetical protein
MTCFHCSRAYLYSPSTSQNPLNLPPGQNTIAILTWRQLFLGRPCTPPLRANPQSPSRDSNPLSQVLASTVAVYHLSYTLGLQPHERNLSTACVRASVHRQFRLLYFWTSVEHVQALSVDQISQLLRLLEVHKAAASGRPKHSTCLISIA